MSPMTLKDITSQLGPKTFMAICKAVDDMCGPGTHFDVLNVTQRKSKVIVRVATDKNKVLRIEHNGGL